MADSATGTLKDNEKKSYVKSPARGVSDTSQEVVVAGEVVVTTIYGDFDEIAVTYPTDSTEVYTYKLATVSVGITTVTYTDSTKKDLSGVVYNAI